MGKCCICNKEITREDPAVIDLVIRFMNNCTK